MDANGSTGSRLAPLSLRPNIGGKIQQKFNQKYNTIFSNMVMVTDNVTAQKVGEALGSLKSLHQQLDEMIEWENHMLKKIGELDIPAGSKEEVSTLS